MNNHLIRIPSVFIFLAGAIGLTLACRPTVTPTLLPPTPTATPIVTYEIEPQAIESGLEELDSYRAELIIDFEGTLGDQLSVGHLETLTEVTRQPSAYHRYLNVAGDLAQSDIPPGVSELFQIEEQLYLKEADESIWSQFSAEQLSTTPLNIFEPEQLIIWPETITTAPITETLNGQGVRHYRFSEADLTASNIVYEQAQGDLWVTTDGDLVVQYILSGTLKITLPNPNIHLFDSGSLSLYYTLRDINAPLTITPPTIADVTMPLSAVPRPSDARIISIFPTLLEYTSAISPVSATLFYRDELAARDWTEDNLVIFNEKADLTFSKENQTLKIIILPIRNDQGIQVLLNLEVAQDVELLVE